ncbi:MAG: hypothetical protein OES46_14875 [Gammaproteobacteria bacterium]|nr:hypothetical protein [Gammaproteobacteria bacterium]
MRTISLASLGLLLLGSISFAYAQKATEIFIPMGKSPGLSYSNYTYMGKIESVNKQKRTIKADGRNIRVSRDTKIWLDRTALKATNIAGRFADLQAGRQVEIKYADAERRQVAEWIKVKVTQP